MYINQSKKLYECFSHLLICKSIILPLYSSSVLINTIRDFSGSSEFLKSEQTCYTSFKKEVYGLNAMIRQKGTTIEPVLNVRYISSKIVSLIININYCYSKCRVVWIVKNRLTYKYNKILRC